MSYSNEIVEVGTDSKIVETTGNNLDLTLEKFQCSAEVVGELFKELGSVTEELSKVRAENAAKKYEEQAKTFIASIKEQTECEIAYLQAKSKKDDDFYNQYDKLREELKDIRKMGLSYLMESKDEDDGTFRMKYYNECEKALKDIEKQMDDLITYKIQDDHEERKTKPSFFDKLLGRDKPRINL